jgi:predicted regulator of Ras-like GTPase activity (Roadblock/LC7/MglB family)
MFKEILRKIIGKMNGEALGTILMDKEGIAVDKIVEDDSLDIETAGMEYSVVLKDIFKAADMMKAGDVSEVLIRTGRFAAILRILDETYFVALFLRSSGSVGRGRYVLRTVSPELKKEL